MKYAVVLTLAVLLGGVALAQHDFFMPVEQFARFKNIPDAKGSGSCVQASLSMCGAHHGMPAAEFLLVQSEYGPPELGGSWPERVERYAQKRGMPIWNVEGSQSVEWIAWALRRGAYVGITYGQAHMIAAVGISADGQQFYVCDNNYPTEIRKVTRDVFVREHRTYGGGWCVILKTFGPPPWTNPKRDPKP